MGSFWAIIQIQGGMVIALFINFTISSPFWQIYLMMEVLKICI
jgi:hypothetical protein